MTLDSVCNELHRSGVGVTRESGGVISFEDKNLVLETGALGTSMPTVLQNTVFLSICILYCMAIKSNTIC